MQNFPTRIAVELHNVFSRSVRPSTESVKSSASQWKGCTGLESTVNPSSLDSPWLRSREMAESDGI